jgi:hypothetical protein
MGNALSVEESGTAAKDASLSYYKVGPLDRVLWMVGQGGRGEPAPTTSTQSFSENKEPLKTTRVGKEIIPFYNYALPGGRYHNLVKSASFPYNGERKMGCSTRSRRDY